MKVEVFHVYSIWQIYTCNIKSFLIQGTTVCWSWNIAQWKFDFLKYNKVLYYKIEANCIYDILIQAIFRSVFYVTNMGFFVIPQAKHHFFNTTNPVLCVSLLVLDVLLTISLKLWTLVEKLPSQWIGSLVCKIDQYVYWSCYRKLKVACRVPVAYLKE